MKAIATLTILLAIISSFSAYGQELVPGVGFSSALELSPGTYTFYLGAGELHFFKVILEPGDVLVVLVRMATNQDFDLYLLNPRRELVGQSIRPTGLTDLAEYVAAEHGPHYIVVTGFGGSTGTYSLTVFIGKPKTVTTTITATATEYVTSTSTTVVFQTQTVVSERVVTAVQERTVEVERVPWTAAGLAVLAAALLYTGYAASSSLIGIVRREERRPTEAETQAPAITVTAQQVTGEKPAEAPPTPSEQQTQKSTEPAN